MPGWRGRLLVFLLAALAVDWRYVLEVGDVVDTDKYYMGVWWVPWTYLGWALSPYTPDYMGILKYNFHPAAPLVYAVYLIVTAAGLNATMVLPLLLHVSLMAGMYILLSRVVESEAVRILGSIAYALNPVASAYYVAVPIAFVPALLPVMVATIIDLARSPGPRSAVKAGLATGFTVSMHASLIPVSATIAALAALYAGIYSGRGREFIRYALLALGVAIAASIPVIVHLYILQAVSPDPQLNYVTRGIDPESVSRGIAYCYGPIDPVGLLTLSWDPCHAQTRIAYSPPPAKLAALLASLSTLALLPAAPRLLAGHRLALALWSPTLLLLTYTAILAISSLGAALDNIVVTALRTPVKLRLAGALAIGVGAAIALDLAVARARGSRDAAVLGVLLLAAILLPAASYGIATVGLETYNGPLPEVERLYHEAPLGPGQRGLIMPYTLRVMMNSPPEMRLLPLNPKPPIAAYLDNSYRAGTLPEALEALGAERLVILKTEPPSTPYDVTLSRGVDPERLEDMVSSSGTYELVWDSSYASIYEARLGLDGLYGAAYIVGEPGLVGYTPYVFAGPGYLPTLVLDDRIAPGMRPVEAYMLSTLYLGEEVGGYGFRSLAGDMLVYGTGLDAGSWSAPELEPHYSRVMEDGVAALGTEFVVSLSSGRPYTVRMATLGGAQLIEVVYDGATVECGGVASPSSGSLSIVYDGESLRVYSAGAVEVCRADVSGPVEVILDGGGPVEVEAAGRIVGPIFLAEARDGWRVYVYRMAYNSLYRVGGAESLVEEPVVADGYSNAWLVRGEPVVVEPLSWAYRAMALIVWGIFYPLAALYSAGVQIKPLKGLRG